MISSMNSMVSMLYKFLGYNWLIIVRLQFLFLVVHITDEFQITHQFNKGFLAHDGSMGRTVYLPTNIYHKNQLFM